MLQPVGPATAAIVSIVITGILTRDLSSSPRMIRANKMADAATNNTTRPTPNHARRGTEVHACPLLVSDDTFLSWITTRTATANPQIAKKAFKT
jgi:hypothetical protein